MITVTGTAGAYNIPSTIATLPEGYTPNNCFVASIQIYYNGYWYCVVAQQPATGIQSIAAPALGNVYLTSDGINATTLIPILANCPVKLLLVKS